MEILDFLLGILGIVGLVGDLFSDDPEKQRIAWRTCGITVLAIIGATVLGLVIYFLAQR